MNTLLCSMGRGGWDVGRVIPIEPKGTILTTGCGSVIQIYKGIALSGVERDLSRLTI